MRNFLWSRSMVGGLILIVGSAALPAAGVSQGVPPSGRYIVVLKDDGSDPGQRAAEHGKAHGFKASHVYRHALRGYAATLPAQAADAIRKRPDVLSVTEDGEVNSQAQPPPPPPCPHFDITGIDVCSTQVPSVAIRRIEGDESSTRSGDGTGTVNVNVAVLDDGGPVEHVDLNVVGSTSCISPGRPPRRTSQGAPFGEHGTKVAGLIGALDNGIGRVGVAPGVRLWAVQVLDEAGFGLSSEVLCGLDWVVSTRTDTDPNNDITVANMSLSGKFISELKDPKVSRESCADTPDHPVPVAICRTIAAGVTIVAAAGNEHTDFQDLWPATFSEVLTVTAIADIDGKPGGLAGFFDCIQGSIQGERGFIDDKVAAFSNFATLPEDQLHTVAALGACLGTTIPGDAYGGGTGTSFAAPAVSGLVALCIANGQCAGLTPRQIVAKIVEDAATYNADNTGYGYEGDPLRPIEGRYYGWLPSASLY